MRAAAAGVAAAALAAAGCSTTQEKSRELASHATAAVAQKGLKVTKRNRRVEVLGTAVVHDRYGTAVVVELRSTASEAQAGIPLAITVRDSAGKREFANDAPGLEPALTHVALLAPHERIYWVHDQVRADRAHDVEAKAGPPTEAVPAKLPHLEVSDLEQDEDPDGVITRGVVKNASRIDQRKVTLFAVALKGGKVVAAGRAGVERIKPGASAHFKVFWIGEPARARVHVYAPPTVLKEEG
jgi:hypothetical protein